MDNNTLFSEKQRFTQWWLWLILLGINGQFLYGIFQQLVRGQTFGDNPMSNAGLILVTGLMVVLTLLFLSFRLETLVKQDGIYVRFFPFQRSFKYYPWASLAKYYVREYAPLREYGGWGLRYGGSGTAYNISGNKGLQLEFTDNRKVLIGTNKAEELTAVLNKIGRTT